MASFYIDNDVSTKTAILLGQQGHDAITTRDIDRRKASDDEQMIVAWQRGRILVTHNEKDFVLLYDAWQRWSTEWHVQRSHPGILILPQGIRYGFNWDEYQIATEIDRFMQRAPPIVNSLYLMRNGIWSRRSGLDWRNSE